MKTKSPIKKDFERFLPKVTPDIDLCNMSIRNVPSEHFEMLHKISDAKGVSLNALMLALIAAACEETK